MTDRFLEEINKMIAPVTHAWRDFEIIKITVDHGGSVADHDGEMCIDCRIILKKEPKHGR